MKGIELFFNRETPIDLSVFDKIEKQLRATLPHEYKLFISEYLPIPQLDEILLLGMALPRKIRECDYAYFYGLDPLEFISYYDRDIFSSDEFVHNFLPVGVSYPNSGFYLKIDGEDIGSIYYFDFNVLDLEEESTKVADSFLEFIQMIEYQPY